MVTVTRLGPVYRGAWSSLPRRGSKLDAAGRSAWAFRARAIGAPAMETPKILARMRALYGPTLEEVRRLGQSGTRHGGEVAASLLALVDRAVGDAVHVAHSARLTDRRRVGASRARHQLLA